jgi:flavin reductase (DIM6/NTAB) family NADH-FMN oxidoreductase RutF
MKKPWNRVNLPVYSISSKAGEEQNMHIITYATAVSMQPKQYVVAVYNGTKTLELIQQQPHFVLQLLAEHQYNLVKLLGQQSGHSISKIQRLQKRKLLTEWNGFAVLAEAIAWMEMKAMALPVNKDFKQPDHQLFLCDVVAYKNANAGDALTVDILREKKVVKM